MTTRWCDRRRMRVISTGKDVAFHGDSTRLLSLLYLSVSLAISWTAQPVPNVSFPVAILFCSGTTTPLRCCLLPPVRCLLSAVCHLPPTAHRPPPTARRLPPATCRPPPAARCMPPAAHHLPPAACCSLPAAHCPLPAACCLLLAACRCHNKNSGAMY